MKSLKERIAIEQAYLDGTTLEYSKRNQNNWKQLFDSVEIMIFNWGEYDYRIKQEPMEFWVNVYEASEIFPYLTEEDAIEFRCGKQGKTIKVREVT